MGISIVMGVPPKIIHFRLGFSLVNHPSMGTPIYGKHHIWVWQILPLVLISGLFFFIILRYPGTHCIPGWRETLQESCRIIQFPWHPTKSLPLMVESPFNPMKSLSFTVKSYEIPIFDDDIPMKSYETSGFSDGPWVRWTTKPVPPPRWSWRRRMDVSCVQMCEVRGESQGPSGA